jgi:hypothetical protein
MIETAVYKHRLYPQLIEASLRQLVPDPFFFENLLEHDAQERFEKQLPLFRWLWREGHLSLHLVCRHRLNIGKFFYEMIQRWLLPGRRLDVTAFFSSDFKFSKHKSHLYTLAEMSVRIDSVIDKEDAEHNLRIIETEIRLGMVSVYHASRLLEMNLLSSQEKMGVVQEKISKLIVHSKDWIDYDIFGELQHFIVMSKEEFKASRKADHLSRLVTRFYLFRHSIAKNTKERQIRLKLSIVELNLPWGIKKVLAVYVGLNFLTETELFEERHLLRAIRGGLLGTKVVADSYFSHEGAEDKIHTLYLEIEKENGLDFTQEEVRHLRRFLPEEIKRSVEVPLRSLFMPRNEEEILRHIVTLSGELKYMRDKPQFILIFDEQKEGDLYFTVVVVRIIYPDSLPIQVLFASSPFTYIPDRVKRVGMVRKRYPKEATIFRLKFSSEPFLRDDQSVDLFRARQAIVQELFHLVGEMRDYTGGMIAKQIEVLGALERLLGGASSFRLESFFHAIYPIEARSIVSPVALKRLFLLWQELLEDPSKKVVQAVNEEALFFMARQGHLLEIDPAEFQEMQLICLRPQQGEKFLGYLFFSTSEEERARFINKAMIHLSHGSTTSGMG